MMKRGYLQQRLHHNHKRLNTRHTLAICLFVALLSSSAYAQNISPSEAAESARQITQGKVLKVKPTKTTRDDKVHYRVKVLSLQGRISYIIIDGDNGEAHPRPQTPHVKHKKRPPKKHHTTTGL